MDHRGRPGSEHDRTLVFGFPPTAEQSAKRRDTADLAVHLSEHAGIRIEPRFATDYRTLAQDLVTGSLDLAWLGPLGVLRAGPGAVPVLVMKRAERTTYQGALFARRDASIRTVADLAGRRIGWVEKDSAAGYVFPYALIAAHRPDVDAFLGEQRVLGSHRAVVEAVLERQVDVGATFVNFDDEGEVAVAGWYEHFPERRDEIAWFTVTNPIPHDMIAVRATLADADRAAVIAALRALDTDHAGQDLRMTVFNGAQGFAPVDASILELLEHMAATAGWR